MDEFLSLQGRHEIVTAVDSITEKNVVMVLNKALGIHHMNSAEIDYLYHYEKGRQPILQRTKSVRPEICNKTVENHAAEIANFTSGYFMGEPVTYVRRGEREGAATEIEQLNDYMFFEDKASHDKEMSMWMAICGVGYRMILPDRAAGEIPDTAPFELDTPDPRNTFVIYHAGFGHRRMMGVREIVHEDASGAVDVTYACYTPTQYFEIKNGAIVVSVNHSLGDIPIFEYRLNMTRMGAFEPAIPLLDAINKVASNRLDGLEQFVQSFLKFVNCEIKDEDISKLSQLGAISVKSENGANADVQIMTQELNQQQTQTLVDYLYDQVLVICGMPTTKKGGTSTSDTGSAVLLRDGWQQCEARARDTELLFKRSEKQFLRLALSIMRGVTETSLSLSEVECKFTRRQHDNLLTKTQALLHMLKAGIHAEVAIASCGMFNDPADVYLQSRSTLRKWDYVELAEPDVTREANDADATNEESVSPD